LYLVFRGLIGLSRRSLEKLLLLLLLLLQLNSAHRLQQQSKTNPTVKIGLLKGQQQPKIQRVVDFMKDFCQLVLAG